MEKSSVKLISNIMLKSRVTKAKDGSISYLPFDLMPEEYGDVRNDQFLSEYQRVQKLKSMFAAKRIVDDNSEENTDDEDATRDEHSEDGESVKENPRNDWIEEDHSNEFYENAISEELCEDAMDLLVKGAYNGWFCLVPYAGSVRDYTDKKTETMHLLVMRKGRQKRVPVSVVYEDRVIYIREELLDLYEKEFGLPEGVEIVRVSRQ